MNERRRAERVAANLFVTMTTGVHKEKIGRGVVVDVSRGGFAVETEADIGLEQIVDCHIEVPLRFRAQVVRRTRPGQLIRYGLKLTEMGFMNRILFKRFLKDALQTRKV